MDMNGSLPPEEPATIFYIGQHETDRDVVSLDLLYQAQGLGYDFISTRITTSTFQTRVTEQLYRYLDSLDKNEGSNDRPLPVISSLTATDTTLTPEDTNSAMVAVVSPWIDLGSRDHVIAHISRQILNLEIAYAAFCGLNNFIIHGPSPSSDMIQYARAVQEALGLGPFIQLHILLPVTGELELDFGDGMHLSELAREIDVDQADDYAIGKDPFASWDNWNTIRSICNYSQKLSIALELPRQLHPASLQSRWYSEPVRLLVYPRTSFLRNAKGYPVLSKDHQQFLSQFARLSFPPWILLSDVGSILSSNSMVTDSQSPEPTPAEAASKANEKPKDPVPHLRYMRHLQQNQTSRPPIERFGQGYQDFLQSPLQPLTDNLESITYEVFERDPVKYDWYERAIASALKDISAMMEESRELVVSIVGAGRGPLVSRALQASKKTGISVKCWAVEKNPNAFVLLQRRNMTDSLWDNKVHVVKSDMRQWPGPVIGGGVGKVDILISELLGSFADNELSPECLDGVQHVLHSEHGVSIPQRYSAHLTPISSPRLHADLLSKPGTEKWELPYVVMLHQFDYLCTKSGPDSTRVPEVKEAWMFSHPAPSSILEQGHARAGGRVDGGGWLGGDGVNEHNIRSCRVTFKTQEQGVCHGLGGYFETVLYDGSEGKIELSTNPVTMADKSKDMISWFPIFFPLKAPLYIPANSEIEVSMWRQTDDRSVWYEWVIEVFEEVNGRKRRIAMSDFHSSRKNGCLM